MEINFFMWPYIKKKYMARKSSVNAEVKENNEEVKVQKEAPEAAIPASENKTELPKAVDKALRINWIYESLYVTDKGETYTVNTPKAIRGKAVLYKNPYYNKTK